MELLDAIKSRRTVHDFRPDPVDRAIIERMLEAAIWAPNHKLTNPWEFYVASGEVKEKLARMRGEFKTQKFDDPTSEQAKRSYQRAYSELATVPWAILVCQRMADDPNRQHEDLLAIACAIQNMMLTATAHGLGTYWGTGPLINHPDTFKLLGVPEGRRAVGIVFVGYPLGENRVPQRESVESHTVWVG